jgi:DNA topoisomerase-2
MGGKDAASARYIYTRLDRIARIIFHVDDDPLLESQVEEGQTIEPKYYVPVIPMVLVNGADGIGTGWSTSLPNYNPRDIIKNVKRFIKGKPMEPMSPWYKGFNGSIAAADSEDKTGYEVVGIAKKTSPTSIEVTELPIRRWTQDYKEFLTKLVDADGENKNGSRIEDFQEYHTENLVHFTLNGTRTQISSLEAEGLDKVLKLRSSLSTNNIVFFDAEGKIKKYANEMELISEFAELRLKYYQRRKDFHTERLRREKELLDAKVRFVLMVIRNELIVSNRKKADLVQDLKSKGFKAYHEIFPKAAKGASSSAAGQVDADTKDPAKGSGYDYLVGMAIWALTMERVEKLKQEMKEKTEEYENLQKLTIQDLWERDLDAILAELKAIDDFEEELRVEEEELKKSGKRGRGKPSTGRRPRRRGETTTAKNDEDEDEEDEAPPPEAKKRKEAAPKDENTNDFLARLKERQKARAKLEMPANSKKLRVS